MQAGQRAAPTAADSDSDDLSDYERYSEPDAFDADDIEVSPDDEQALAAFMVSCTNLAGRRTKILVALHTLHCT